MTGETLERVESDDGDVFECFVCGGRSPTRLPSHEPDCLVVHEGTDAVVYNRPAVIERVYRSSVRVRFQDNGTLDYVTHDAVGVLEQ